MDLSPLRALAQDLILHTHGVDAMVTRPAPDTTPIATTVLWDTRPRVDPQPTGTDFSRLGPRRILAVPKADVPIVPRGTLIQAAEATGGSSLHWRVDGIERVSATLTYVVVVPSV